MDVKSISILGSTGSIGTQALQVADKLNLKVDAICANTNISLLEDQIRCYKPALCAVYDRKLAEELKIKTADTATKIIAGSAGLNEAAVCGSGGVVLNALSGQIGIEPTLAALNNKKNVALANKETLVAAGDIIIEAAKKNGVRIIPVDSEHSAIFQCLEAGGNKYADKLILTASGGPFFNADKEFLDGVTPEQALKHPTWSMGKKISIDSATMMNKGLELIEAVHLFGMSPDNIDIVVHRESIIHSLVQFSDYSVLCQLGYPDMRMFIQYALTYPERMESLCKPVDLAAIGSITFNKIDEELFPFPSLARKVIKAGGTAPFVFNCANEAAVDLFLKNKIKFTQIYDVVEETVQRHKPEKTVEAILFDEISGWTHSEVEKILE